MISLQLPEKASYLLAVSGGLDSVCMLHLFAQCKHNAARICVATVNHGMRGEESNADVLFVQKLAQKAGFPFFSITLDPVNLMGKGGFEALARNHRYAALKQIQMEQNLDWICTAHHLDDQIETLLLRMLRGTGLAGLKGVHRFRADGIFRPLLDFSKNDLLNYANDNGLVWREDGSNLDLKYKRNYIRHQFIAKLQEEDPEIKVKLTRIQELYCRIEGKIAPILANSSTKALKKPIDDEFQTRQPDLNMYLFDWQFYLKTETKSPRDSFEAKTVLLDADRIVGNPVLRFRKDGDRFCPKGLKTSQRKLKKFFQEKRIPQRLRNFVPLIAVEDEVLWIPDYEVSGNHIVSESTHRILELRLKEWKNR